ncbi:hypothetical protein ACGFJ7_02705 [Actinoplanes sp. NPDC048988]|uniref:MmyB family transcriptional regulator n=1 Tax=Actinoplanes sp. NPDC048988 TaxID=3363901 RepID=UPI00371D43A3
MANVPLLLGAGPAYVIDGRYDVLSHNPPVFDPFPGLAATGDPPNLARWTFLAPEARRAVVDREVEARGLLARLRSIAAKHEGDPRFESLVDELREGCPEVRRWWRHYDVEPRHGGRKRPRGPDGEIIDYAYAVFHVAERPEQTLVVYATSGDAGV